MIRSAFGERKYETILLSHRKACKAGQSAYAHYCHTDIHFCVSRDIRRITAVLNNANSLGNNLIDSYASDEEKNISMYSTIIELGMMQINDMSIEF